MEMGDVVQHQHTKRLYVFDFETERGRAAVQRFNRTKINMQVFDPNILTLIPTVEPVKHDWTMYEQCMDKPDNGRIQVRSKPLRSSQCHAYLKYDPLTGQLTYKAPLGRLCWVGLPAGAKTHNGYTVVTLNGYSAFAHRIAWMMYAGEWPTGQVYHIDGNRDNNAISNLRMLP